MEKPLKGILKISFELDLDNANQISVSDVAQSLLEGFGEEFLERVSNLNVESIEKHGEIESKDLLKIGDMVQLKEDIKISAMIYSDDGYHFIGKPNDISEEVTYEPTILNIEAGSFGYVNQVIGNKVEVIDIDRPITKYAGAGIDAVNVDLIIIDSDKLEKIDIQEVR